MKPIFDVGPRWNLFRGQRIRGPQKFESLRGYIWVHALTFLYN